MISKLKPKPQKKQKQNSQITMKDLMNIANNPKSSKADLIVAMELFYQNFKVSQNEKEAFELFSKILNHKNRSKEVFSIFHGKILPANIEYKKELDALERAALNRN